MTDPEMGITPEMVAAGAEVIDDADWEFRGDSSEVARRVYLAMDSKRRGIQSPGGVPHETLQP